MTTESISESTSAKMIEEVHASDATADVKAMAIELLDPAAQREAIANDMKSNELIRSKLVAMRARIEAQIRRVDEHSHWGRRILETIAIEMDAAR